MRSFLYTLVILATFVAHGGAEISPRIDTITAEDAKRLAQENRGRLLLDGLTTLSPEAAAELARSEGWLSLNGLTSLSNETASTIPTTTCLTMFGTRASSADWPEWRWPNFRCRTVCSTPSLKTTYWTYSPT